MAAGLVLGALAALSVVSLVQGSSANSSALRGSVGSAGNRTQGVLGTRSCSRKTREYWQTVDWGRDGSCHPSLYNLPFGDIAGCGDICFNDLVAKNDVMLVVSSQKEDVSWLREVATPMTIYTHDGGTPQHFQSIHDVQAANPHVRTDTLPNRGLDGAAYLKYIIDHYEKLPQVSVYVHAHPTAWHSKVAQPRLLDNLRFSEDFRYRTINSCDYGSESTAGLQCNNLRTGSGDGMRIGLLKRYWPRLFEARFGKLEDQGDTWCVACCGQFAAHRDAIRQHPKEFYQHMYDAVMAEEGRDRGMWCYEFFWTHTLAPEVAFPHRGLGRQGQVSQSSLAEVRLHKSLSGRVSREVPRPSTAPSSTPRDAGDSPGTRWEFPGIASLFLHVFVFLPRYLALRFLS